MGSYKKFAFEAVNTFTLRIMCAGVVYGFSYHQAMEKARALCDRSGEIRASCYDMRVWEIEDYTR